MKKWILILAFLLVALITLSSCEEKHKWSEWEIYSSSTNRCDGKVYSRYCLDCNKLDFKKGSHDYNNELSHNTEYHWYECKNCGLTKDKSVHIMSDRSCTECGYLESQINGIFYKISEDGTYASVVGYEGNYENIVINSTYDGVPVTEISDAAFYECISMKSIDIPDSITSIGYSAFGFCSSLNSLTIPESVDYIDHAAFAYCDSLKDINVDANNQYYQSIDGNLYDIEGSTLIQYAIGKDNTSFTIPDGVTFIGYYAFSGCKDLSNVVIPNSVTDIGDGAFSDCYSIANMVIPESVTTINPSAFSNCKSLTSIEVNKNNPNYASIDGNLYSKDGKTLIQYAIGKKAKTFEIPQYVTKIKGNAFSTCSNLVNIIIGDNIVSIDNSAFDYCDNLVYIEVDEINPHYKSIDGNLYSKDGKTLIQYAIGKKAKTFEIPQYVTKIKSNAFSTCLYLCNVIIHNGVSSISSFAFSGCENLTSIVIPDSVTSIGWGAFSGCKNLASIVIPDSVTSIGWLAFSGCESLTNVVIGDSVTSIDTFSFSGCSSLTSVVIPNTVTSIGDFAFYYCSILTDVYYIGTEEQWAAITIGSSNEDLINATIHYNYIPEE